MAPEIVGSWHANLTWTRVNPAWSFIRADAGGTDAPDAELIMKKHESIYTPLLARD
ncbi:hypothetical protein [Rhodococcus erythropolis]|uniref:hypothetical protein n=1 Tax=Rhodococcus erythropolis TaxID=1833 RepID=UPI00038E4978|nr:hypothetical protein [Rhodococcus erythropolis]EQM30187.1 hypothetical protein N601_29025 [Rhodococcus erythropolis DN1]MBF7733972.1 hypothetical protein [Rhodococcus erythropolis]MCZ4639580.1 hypothetical protein [Rhodococcus erythropolis]